MKVLYKIGLLVIAFIASLFFFRNDVPGLSVETTTATGIQDSKFPMITMETNDIKINQLYGYSEKLDCGSIRSAMVPISDDKKLSICISENESVIKKLTYSLIDMDNDKDINSDQVSAFEMVDGEKKATLSFDGAIETGREYGLEIVLTTNKSKRIYFYSRLKYYSEDYFLEKKLAFVNKFHEACFKPNNDFKISKYLEENTNDDSTYAQVDIHSSYKMIKWGKLKPKRITVPIPKIREINIETASVSQVYYISAETASGKEFYVVKEFYRVRYSAGQIFLLNFRRNMEALFDPSLASVKKGEFKVGISSVNDFEITTSESKDHTAFVRNGAVWYYNMKNNKITNIFTFENGENKNYNTLSYDQHNAKILRIDDNGNVAFMVYGYMGSGDYEGRVGILLYEYDSKKNNITERVYIPLSTTYELLKENLGEFCYYNDQNVFYFSLNNKVYAYNISSKRYDVLTKNAVKDHLLMLRDAKSFVWADIDKEGNANTITVLNLDSSKEKEIKSEDGENIVVLGTIDSNIVYGYVRNEDIYLSKEGSRVRPAYKIVIADCDGKKLREYSVKNIYVTGANVEENIIRLKRVKKKNGKWQATNDDTILNKRKEAKGDVSVTTRITDKALTELYISMPTGYVMQDKPGVDMTESIIVTENTTLHLPDTEDKNIKYYVYSYGQLTKSYNDPGKAIMQADEEMGVVMDNRNNVIWERSGHYKSKELANISYPDKSVSSITACAYMLMQSAQVTKDISQLKGNSIMKILKNNIDRPMNLTNCKLEETLYFISKERPVGAMISPNKAVLLMAYNESTIYYMDPDTRSKKKMSMAKASQVFKDAGNVFISFIE